LGGSDLKRRQLGTGQPDRCGQPIIEESPEALGSPVAAALQRAIGAKKGHGFNEAATISYGIQKRDALRFPALR